MASTSRVPVAVALTAAALLAPGRGVAQREPREPDSTPPVVVVPAESPAEREIERASAVTPVAASAQPAGSAQPVLDGTSPTCAAQAHARAASALVRVDSGGRHGGGVLVVDSAHVITLLRIVERGHSITVTDATGNRRRARIVGTADADELAMLALDAPLPGAPLPIAPWDAVTVGLPVAVLGLPAERTPRHLPDTFRGTLPWAASEGVVAARGERAIQTDARIESPRGSPIVTCAGELVAVLGPRHHRMGGAVVRSMPAVPAIRDLVGRLDFPEGYGGRWHLTAGIALAAAYEDPGSLWGGTLMLGLVGYDAFLVAARFTYLRTSFEPTGSDVARVTKDRIRGDAYLAWRQLVVLGSMATYFELGAGASVTRWSREERRAEIVDGTAGPEVRWTEVESDDWSVRPMAVLSLLLGPLMLSYTLEVDIDREHVVHLFGVGVRAH